MISTCSNWFLISNQTTAIGTIFSSTDTVCTLQVTKTIYQIFLVASSRTLSVVNFYAVQVLHQDETPLLYSLVFGEGVVNDATSVVLFNAVQKIDVNRLDWSSALKIFGDFLYLFSTSTLLGIAVGILF